MVDTVPSYAATSPDMIRGFAACVCMSSLTLSTGAVAVFAMQPASPPASQSIAIVNASVRTAGLTPPSLTGCTATVLMPEHAGSETGGLRRREQRSAARGRMFELVDCPLSPQQPDCLRLYWVTLPTGDINNKCNLYWATARGLLLVTIVSMVRSITSVTCAGREIDEQGQESTVRSTPSYLESLRPRGARTVARREGVSQI